MKNPMLVRGLAGIAACALLLPTAASAQTTSYTATGWVYQVLAPGLLCTNALGQVLLRANVHVARVHSSDSRMTGDRLIVVDGNYNADGTVNFQGTTYQQVGTWDVAGTNFTPTGGMWEATWRGVMQADYSLQLSIVGYGSGGAIDGLRLEETLTRGPASGLIDFTVPYLYTGTIKPAPVSSTLASDSFDPPVSGWVPKYNCGAIEVYGTNYQLYTRANWANCPPQTMQNYFFAERASPPWNLADGQTLECQADLIRISENTTNGATITVGNYPHTYIYGFHLSQAGAGLHKWTLATPNDITMFWWDNSVHVARTNVVLYMALTRDNGSLIITTRVLDKANLNAVLFERSFVDTPGVDVYLTTAQYRALTGITSFTLVPDPGAPFFGGSRGGVGAWQFTDGHQPPVEAIFDNFALRLHDEPPLNIARAVQVTWTAPAGVNYALEAASAVQGPYAPVQELALPGIQKQTVPLSGPAQFFRLVQVP
jgi:hypothetical protein